MFPCRWLRTRTELASGKRFGGSSQLPSNPWPISWPEELSTKLDTEMSFRLDGLYAHDLQGRATSFQKIVAGGMDVSEAVAVSGLVVPFQNVSDT